MPKHFSTANTLSNLTGFFLLVSLLSFLPPSFGQSPGISNNDCAVNNPIIQRAPGYAGSVKTGGNLQFVRWQDPAEGSFYLEAPRGWLVQGGLHRASAIDVRPWIRVISRDRRVQIFSGDPRLHYFSVPNWTLEMSGYREGSWYSPGYGARLMVMRYRPGVEFALMDLPAMLPGANGFRLYTKRNRPDVVQAINAISQRYGFPNIQQRSDAGETFFSCTLGRQPLLGYAFANTTLTQGYGIAQWRVASFFGYFATPERVREAQYVLAHMIKTTRVNLQWARTQQGMTGAVANIVADTNAYVSNIITNSFNDTQKRLANSAYRDALARRGVTHATDPRTGQVYELPNNSSHYWIDNRGNILGTDAHSNPDGLRYEEMGNAP